MTKLSKIQEIIRRAEGELLNKTGHVYRLSIEYALPEFAQEGVTQMCRIWQVNEDVLRLRTKTAALATMRFIVMKFLLEECRLKTVSIAQYFGLDHTSVLHGINKCRTYLHTQDTLFMGYYEPVSHVFEPAK